MATLTLSRAFLALHGVAPGALQGPVLRRDIAVALRPVLLSYGFDVTGPIGVRQLKGNQGFHLMQPPVSIARLWGEAGMNDETRCALCEQPIAEGQHKVAQADGRLAHVTCWAADHQPSTRPTPDPICTGCSKPIRPTESIIKSDADLVHVKCFLAEDGPSAT